MIPFSTKPDGAKFTFGGWELSVTNKSVKLYSELITYDNATTGAVYRRDKNYLKSEQPDISDNSTCLTNNLMYQMRVLWKRIWMQLSII